MSDHKLSRQDSFNNWSRQTLNRHEQAVINLQNWFFALARLAEISPEALAKGILESSANYSFGKNLQIRLKEETQKAMEKEKTDIASKFAVPEANPEKTAS